MVRFIERNGLRFAFSDSGPRSASQTIVIIHGWADRHELFTPISQHFSKQYRVIAVDLRGHGQSSKPEKGYEIATLAEDVAAICERLGRKNYHLFGHSLGGAVSLEVAARHSDRVLTVTSVEGAGMFPASFREAMKPFGQALRGPEWKKAMREFTDSCYWPGDRAELRQYSYRELDRLPRHVHVGVFDGVMGWDGEQAARAWKKPYLYIEGGSGLCDFPRLKTLCPQLLVGQTIGVSHMEIVATPGQVLAMTDRFLQLHANGLRK